jgi:hypothetical protein
MFVSSLHIAPPSALAPRFKYVYTPSPREGTQAMARASDAQPEPAEQGGLF